jgi:hypothetical protein
MPTHDVFLRKPRLFTQFSPYGGRSHFVQIGGQLFEARRHHSTGLRNHESFHSIAGSSFGSSLAAPVAPERTTAPHEGLESTKIARPTPKVPPRVHVQGPHGGAQYAQLQAQGSVGLTRPEVAKTPTATKKKLSSILNGGALAPL